jgi:hypothetical protein
MQIAGQNVDPSDVIAAAAVLVSLFFYRQNRGIATDSKSMAEANKTMAGTNMSMADSAKLSALAALDAVEFQRKADLPGSEGLCAVGPRARLGRTDLVPCGQHG